MGNSVQHAMLGATLGFGCYLLYKLITKKAFEWDKAIICTGLGTVCGILPDVLESATSPNHRKFAHSLVFLSGLTIGEIKIIEDKKLSEEYKLFLSSAIVGYGCHLFLDSSTPRGLPAI